MHKLYPLQFSGKNYASFIFYNYLTKILFIQNLTFALEKTVVCWGSKAGVSPDSKNLKSSIMRTTFWGNPHSAASCLSLSSPSGGHEHLAWKAHEAVLLGAAFQQLAFPPGPMWSRQLSWQQAWALNADSSLQSWWRNCSHGSSLTGCPELLETASDWQVAKWQSRSWRSLLASTNWPTTKHCRSPKVCSSCCTGPTLCSAAKSKPPWNLP